MRRLAILLAVVLVPLVARPVPACSCAEPGPVLESAAEADAVFLARVTSMVLVPDRDPDVGIVEDALVTLEVIESWKGVTTATVQVRTSWTCCLCGYPFDLGMTYVVYAYADEAHGVLRASACSRTRTDSEGTDDLPVLRRAFPALPLDPG